jgi:hypothetical protein
MTTMAQARDRVRASRAHSFLVTLCCTGALSACGDAALGTPEQVAALQQQLLAFTNPATPAAEREAAFQALAAFLTALPASHPGAVFQRLPLASAVQQLSLPLLACPSLPAVATLQGLGCFELSVGTACAQLINTLRGCAQWGSTLEQIMPNGTLACQAAGLADKAEMEDFVFAFETNLRRSWASRSRWAPTQRPPYARASTC